MLMSMVDTFDIIKETCTDSQNWLRVKYSAVKSAFNLFGVLKKIIRQGFKKQNKTDEWYEKRMEYHGWIKMRKKGKQNENFQSWILNHIQVVKSPCKNGNIKPMII